jgi:hypothetical protein
MSNILPEYAPIVATVGLFIGVFLLSNGIARGAGYRE